jgi:mono/diheme cytochrome c family protein
MRVLKWFIGLVALLLGIAVLAAIAVFAITETWLGERYDIAVAPVAIATEPADIAEGRRLAVTRGCTDCHGADLGGRAVVDDSAMGVFYASNLTAGSGGIAGQYDVADWQRAIRHGIGADGRPLVLMPSFEYFPMGDADIGRLIAYMTTVPPVDRVAQPVSVGPMARLLLSIGEIKLSARMIDHAAPRPATPTPGPTAAYGAYLAVGCTGCHGESFSGGKIPGVPPEWPAASNITPDPDTGLGKWSPADFETALRRGVRPDGRKLDPVMPSAQFVELTDDEVEALWAYLKTRPPNGFGNR